VDVGDGCCGRGQPTSSTDIARTDGDRIVFGIFNTRKSAKTNAKSCYDLVRNAGGGKCDEARCMTWWRVFKLNFEVSATSELGICNFKCSSLRKC